MSTLKSAGLVLSCALLACSGAGTDVTSTTAKTGTLSVSVTGLAASALAAGSVSVSPTDGSGQSPLALVIPNGAGGAAARTQVSVGRYAVVYSPPSGYVLAAGALNVQAAIIGQAGDSAGVTFAVTPAPAPVSYDGLWSGTTSDGGLISFTIAGGVVTNISVALRLTGDCGVSTATIAVRGQVAEVESDQTFSVGDETSVLQINGSFTSPTESTGSAWTLYTTAPPSGGTCTGSNTWVARR